MAKKRGIFDFFFSKFKFETLEICSKNYKNAVKHKKVYNYCNKKYVFFLEKLIPLFRKSVVSSVNVNNMKKYNFIFFKKVFHI